MPDIIDTALGGHNAYSGEVLIFDGNVAEVDVTVRRAASFLDEKKDEISKVRTKLKEAGTTASIAALKNHLHSRGLDRTQRFLLSRPGVWASLVGKALEAAKTGKVKTDDTLGLADMVLLDLVPERDKLARTLVQDVEKRAALRLAPGERNQILEQLKNSDLLIESSKFDEKVKTLAAEIRAAGKLPEILADYIKTSGIDKSRFTEPVKRSMLAYLLRIGIDANPPDAKKPKGAKGRKLPAKLEETYEDLFNLAYNHAIDNADGEGADPIDAVRQKGRVTDWNFQVDTFETVEEQGIVKENILAAGALDYVYELGERMGIFKLADAIVHRWASGQIDLQTGESTAKMYRYWKLRSERMQDDERAMLYKRVLNLGDSELLSGSVANEQFPVLWGALMEKVTEYITRTEEKKSEERSVSRTPIYQATKQLQYNLTEYMTGMAHLQVTEMYRQMQEAKSILEDAQIVDYFGNGRRRTLWTVIERGHKDILGEPINISAIRTSAIDGNRVFQWIANFDQATVNDADFEEFRNAAESWIIAQSMEGDEPATAGVDDDDDAGTKDNGNGKKDSFDSDWDS
jgi:hypothetical protein